MSNVPVIVDIARSPMGRGKMGGVLSSLHPADLLMQVLVGLVERNNLDPGTVDDLIMGCVSQAGEQAVPVGRTAWLGAGYPVHVPCTMVERRCGSSQQAVHFAAQGIAAGAYDIVLAGGIESMSRVPMGMARIGADPHGVAFEARFPGQVGQGISAELIAARWGISREEMDEYSARSHQLAESARVAGNLAREIIPIRTADGTVVSQDETIRATTTAEGLAQLKTSFNNDELGQRFPEINWSVTAGNSSQITDGASAALVMSEATANRLGLKPLARFVAFDVIGDDPLLMLTAPIPATQRVLKKAGLSIEQIDHIEVNEAFAPVPLAWQREMKADPARLNPRGGAIALGHPLGASGTRLMSSMIHGLHETGGRYGLQTMCEAGGLANATIIERI
ncbi:acetyl-CoA acetyltransferase family protein [Novosphingobium hassiacum]|uniref:Acetyl-CoA acetyltransferase family protein n=1 Tax=Novosphingobium hassiacum TaxID=173676 RepID=A0A7W6EX84_9SPHN|nr:thiolase family protein [Novosphingobium hassiacum]MBB3862142.1 acetyl-CoA acetyltransferase family protein [Novosphingobium hassiacum]